jgi:hypothetical protein
MRATQASFREKYRKGKSVSRREGEWNGANKTGEETRS